MGKEDVLISVSLSSKFFPPARCCILEHQFSLSVRSENCPEKQEYSAALKENKIGRERVLGNMLFVFLSVAICFITFPLPLFHFCSVV